MVAINLESHEITDIRHSCPTVHYHMWPLLLAPLYRGCNGLRPSLNSQNCSKRKAYLDVIFDEEPEEMENTDTLFVLGSSTVDLVDLI